jgi:hypothetical protein
MVCSSSSRDSRLSHPLPRTLRPNLPPPRNSQTGYSMAGSSSSRDSRAESSFSKELQDRLLHGRLILLQGL